MQQRRQDVKQGCALLLLLLCQWSCWIKQVGCLLQLLINNLSDGGSTAGAGQQ
jgi:hypothetical protein